MAKDQLAVVVMVDSRKANNPAMEEDLITAAAEARMVKVGVSMVDPVDTEEVCPPWTIKSAGGSFCGCYTDEASIAGSGGGGYGGRGGSFK